VCAKIGPDAVISVVGGSFGPSSSHKHLSCSDSLDPPFPLSPLLHLAVLLLVLQSSVLPHSCDRSFIGLHFFFHLHSVKTTSVGCDFGRSKKERANREFKREITARWYFLFEADCRLT
jgi:hypothetical protein